MRTTPINELEDEELEDDFEEDEDDFDEEDDEDERFVGLTASDKLTLIAQIADSMRATEMVALDLRPLTIIADFFLICTGNSSIQIRAIADKIEEKLREIGERKLRVEGYQEATWILLDYGNVVVHVMAAEQREFFNLEDFWKEAPRVELQITVEPTTLNAPRFDAPDA